MIVGGKEFANYTYAMAIINLTPDSFWKNSRKDEYDICKAVERALTEGAAIVDIGAQSTRPGYTEISAEEEIARLEKPLLAVRKRFSVPISVDTYFAKTADFALSLGADMINDIWGLAYDSAMAPTVAKHGASICIMHNAKTQLLGDIWRPITEFLQKSVDIALQNGIKKDRICLDGGIGFAKDKQQNLQLLHDYQKLSVLGYPLLLGASRKSLFGGDVQDRLAPTVQATYQAAKQGVLFVRVHDVKPNVEAIKKAYGDD